MGKLEQFEILFDDPYGIFFAGQTVTGKVIVVLNEEMKMRKITLQCSGKAATRWSKTETITLGHGQDKKRKRVTKHYSGHEVYMNNTVLLMGGNSDSEVLPSGSHEYPFSFQLPPICPTSYEGQIGHIRYFCTAIIDKPWKFDHKTKRTFTVMEVIDLNVDPACRAKVETQDFKELGSMCCKAGNINAVAKIPRAGFVCGQKIPVLLEVTNNSSRGIKKVEARLHQRTIFRGTSATISNSNHYPDYKESNRAVARIVKNENTPEGQSVSWTRESLSIPPVPPVSKNCKVISIDYYITIDVVPTGPSFSIKLNLPIIIGTIPMQDDMTNLQNYENSGHEGPSFPGQQYPSLPAPSYGTMDQPVNVKEDDDNEHTRGDMNFAPKYAYYDWSK